jgi:hypothetical protein
MSFRSARLRSLLLAGLVAVLALFLTARPTFASPELRAVLRDLAAEIKHVLAGEKEKELVILQFTGPPSVPGASEALLRQLLTEELARVDIKVALSAKFGVKGSFAKVELPASNPDDARIGKKVLGINLTASVVDDNGLPLGNLNFNREMRGEATFVTLLPLAVALPPDGTELERDAALRTAFNKKTRKTDIQGSVIRSDPNKPYAVEIVVDGKAREAEEKDGLAFVPIQRGESYAVRLINDSELEAAVQLRIDGLSMFAFSKQRQPDKDARGRDNPNKGEPLYSVVIVPSKSSAVIPGWYINSEKTDRFLVTEFARSGAALLKPTGGIGTINATFQAAWEKDADPPKDEPGKKRGVGSGDATGRGPRIEKKYQEVQRELGVIRDAISVRYTREAGK